MRATDILRNEHDSILSMLELLETHCGHVGRGKPLNLEFARWCLGFIRQFADDQHHGKEEGVLFPLLEKRGMPRQTGPLAVMLHEHDQGRAFVTGMERALDAGDAAAFAQHASAYAGLLQQHIAKENQVLFAMAEQMLSAEDDAGALQEFGRVVHDSGGVMIRQRYLPAIDRWREVFGLL